ncbi:unnamed protein product, partial [Linum tenue]
NKNTGFNVVSLINRTSPRESKLSKSILFSLFTSIHEPYTYI